MSAISIVRDAGEGERRWFYGGGVHTWKASSEETGGTLILFEAQMAQAKATPLHVHANEDEALYVLEGEILVHIDGEDHRLGPGGFAFAPRGVPHAFLITSREARILCLETPGSAEAFYLGASEPAGADADSHGPVDFDKVRESAERSGGMRVVGPPPFDVAHSR
jgi:quercetin dioxygenase-like cupin family protein